MQDAQLTSLEIVIAFPMLLLYKLKSGLLCCQHLTRVQLI